MKWFFYFCKFINTRIFHQKNTFIKTYLVLKVLIRPVLWSTTNTFLCCLLSLNALLLLCKLFLISDKINSTTDDVILQALDYLLLAKENSRICSALFIVGFIYQFVTLSVLLVIINIRMMMINYAEHIRTSSMICRNHQAQLSKIGAFGSVY